MHVERCRICCADPFKSSFAAPEFHVALEVRVKNPHARLDPKGPGPSQLSPEASLLQAEKITERRGRRSKMNGMAKIEP